MANVAICALKKNLPSLTNIEFGKSEKKKKQ